MKSIFFLYCSGLFGSACVLFLLQYGLVSAKQIKTAITTFQYPIFTILFYLGVLSYLAFFYFYIKNKENSKKIMKQIQMNNTERLGLAFTFIGILISGIFRYQKIVVSLAKTFILIGIISQIYWIFKFFKKDK